MKDASPLLDMFTIFAIISCNGTTNSNSLNNYTILSDANCILPGRAFLIQCNNSMFVYICISSQQDTGIA